MESKNRHQDKARSLHRGKEPGVLSPQTRCADDRAFLYLVHIYSYARHFPKPTLVATCEYRPNAERVQIITNNPLLQESLERGILKLGGEEHLTVHDGYRFLENLKYEFSGAMVRATDVQTIRVQEGGGGE